MGHLLAFGFAVSSILLAADGQSNVRVHVTDAFGNALATAAIFVSSADARTQVAQDQVIRLPYGSYTVSARVPGSSDRTLQVAINQPEQIVVVGMRLGAMEAPVPTCSILGRIDPGRDTSGGPARLRLLQLFGDYLVDVPIAAGGFEFTNLECGDYMVIAMGQNGCIGTKIVRTTPFIQPLTLKLPAGAGARCTTLE